MNWTRLVVGVITVAALTACSSNSSTPLFEAISSADELSVDGEPDQGIDDFATRSEVAIIGTLVGYRVEQGAQYTPAPQDEPDFVIHEEIVFLKVKPPGAAGTLEFEVLNYYSSDQPSFALAKRRGLSLPAGQAMFILNRTDDGSWTCAAEDDAWCVLQTSDQGAWVAGGLDGTRGNSLAADPVSASNGLAVAAGVISEKHGLGLLGAGSGDTARNVEELTRAADE